MGEGQGKGATRTRGERGKGPATRGLRREREGLRGWAALLADQPDLLPGSLPHLWPQVGLSEGVVPHVWMAQVTVSCALRPPLLSPRCPLSYKDPCLLGQG